MGHPDAFENLARYYDALMAHVDYARWSTVVQALATLFPEPPIHLDVGCGTGTLVKQLRAAGWPSQGVDLSPAMVRTGRIDAAFPAAVADACALPYRESVDCVTCLFDSLNFLLSFEALKRALASAYAALRPGGLYYFDFVTERMVTEHFAGQSWTENNGGFRSRWATSYDVVSKTSETRIRINQRPDAVIHERVYPSDAMHAATVEAGFTVLGMMDAETWRPVRKKTVRVEVVAAKAPISTLRRDFKRVASRVEAALQGHTA